MIFIKEVMHKRFLPIDINEDLHAAAKKLIKRGHSCLIVMHQGSIQGIITEKDLLKNATLKKKHLHEVTTQDIMSSPVLTIEPDSDIFVATKLMNKYKIKRLPVMHNGGVVGVVTQTDLIRNMTKILHDRVNKVCSKMADLKQKLQKVQAGKLAALEKRIKQVGKA